MFSWLIEVSAAVFKQGLPVTDDFPSTCNLASQVRRPCPRLLCCTPIPYAECYPQLRTQSLFTSKRFLQSGLQLIPTPDKPLLVYVCGLSVTLSLMDAVMSTLVTQTGCKGLVDGRIEAVLSSNTVQLDDDDDDASPGNITGRLAKQASDLSTRGTTSIGRSSSNTTSDIAADARVLLSLDPDVGLADIDERGLTFTDGGYLVTELRPVVTSSNMPWVKGGSTSVKLRSKETTRNVTADLAADFVWSSIIQLVDGYQGDLRSGLAKGLNASQEVGARKTVATVSAKKVWWMSCLHAYYLLPSTHPARSPSAGHPLFRKLPIVASTTLVLHACHDRVYFALIAGQSCHCRCVPLGRGPRSRYLHQGICHTFRQQPATGP